MKKILTLRLRSTRDEFATTERHIHFPRIRDFAENRIDFTESESAHYEVCRACRLKVIEAIIRATQAESTGRLMAA